MPNGDKPPRRIHEARPLRPKRPRKTWNHRFERTHPRPLESGAGYRRRGALSQRARQGEVGNLIAIGLNYSDHAAETGAPIPKEPIIFNKVTSCICGPNDNTIIPKDSSKLDWEVELAIVIGQRAHYLSKDKALDVVAGYCLANDVSERVFQLERSGQWIKGKSAETFGPLGPCLVTKDEIRDPQRLSMWLDVNGEKRQRGNTSTMIFDCRHLVWCCSQYFVLQPGDVILTGTPPGVGLGMKPQPKFLKAGDVVTLGIDGLGEQRQKVLKAKA